MSLGMPFLLLDTAVNSHLPHNCKQFTIVSDSTNSTTKLHQLVATVSLHNPFWNNFRLLNFFVKRKIHLTLDELTQLKEEAGVGTRQAIYQALIQQYFEGDTDLNPHQIRFIERLNPAFSDRHLHSGNPGDLLIYECLSPRRLKNYFKGHLGLHLFIDMFNGYAFGALSHDRSPQAGLHLLNEQIVPFYHAHDTSVSTIYFSLKPTLTRCAESPDATLVQQLSDPTISWQETDRTFGTIEAFHKFILVEFFEGMRLYGTSGSMLHISFDRWLKQQNLNRSFYNHFSFFQYIDIGRCLQLSLD